MLNELKYNVNSFDNLDEDDVIIVFRGNIYPIYINDYTEENIEYIINIIKILCKTFDGLYDTFFDEDGNILPSYMESPQLLMKALGKFEGLPKLLYGYVTEYDGNYALAFDYSQYDVPNSKELKQLLNTDIVDQFGYILLNGKEYTLEELRGGSFDNRKEDNTDIAPRLFHGTTTKYLKDIMANGIRQIASNSMFKVENKGYVYLTSVFESALHYAEIYKANKGGEECVIEVDSSKIDSNRIVLDYDFASEFTTDIENSPYDGRIKPNGKFYKGNVARNTSKSGTKYGKIGYKGIIMPSAILGAYIVNDDGEQIYHDIRSLKEIYSEKLDEEMDKKDKKYARQDIMLDVTAADCAVTEGQEAINEVDADDVSLKSFKVQDELNPKFWIDGKINSRVRLKLLDLADEFYDSLNIKWVKPKDIILTGSIANYNWSKYSDVDVHILVDYEKVWKKTDIIQDYFDSKKQLWADEHDGLKIYGFPVELYVEDANVKNPNSGIYSLEKNEWIVEPGDFQDAELNEERIKEISAKYMTEIDDAYEDIKKEKDNHRLETFSTKMKKLFDKLRKQRKESLDKHGEMGTYNIVWKVLRRSGHLDKIWEIINNVYNKVNSIKEDKQRTICITEEQSRMIRETMKMH